MLKLAFSSNAFKKHSLEEAIRLISSIGYAGIEIMADVPHAYPPQLSASQRVAMRQLLSSLDLAVSNINAFTLFAAGDTYHPTFFEPDLAKRELRIIHSILAIELAGELGSNTVSLQPGGPLIGTSFTREQAAELFAQGLHRLLPAARSANVTLAIEPEPGLFIESASEYRQFKDQYFPDEPRVKMNCDVGHLFCVGDDPAEVLRIMSDDIAHVHLEDIGKNHVHQHLPLGDGAMDLAGIFAALDEIHYSGWVTVELYPYETSAARVAQAAWDYINQVPNNQ